MTSRKVRAALKEFAIGTRKAVWAVLVTVWALWLGGCAAPYGDRNGTDTSGRGASGDRPPPSDQGHAGGHHH